MTKQIPLSWDVDTLNKAYRQGYMAGVMGMDKHKCPYRSEVVAAAWEAGWDDGDAAHREHQAGGAIGNIA